MKKILLLLAVFSLIACDKDDELQLDVNTNTKKEPLQTIITNMMFGRYVTRMDYVYTNDSTVMTMYQNNVAEQKTVTIKGGMSTRTWTYLSTGRDQWELKTIEDKNYLDQALTLVENENRYIFNLHNTTCYHYEYEYYSKTGLDYTLKEYIDGTLSSRIESRLKSRQQTYKYYDIVNGESVWQSTTETFYDKKMRPILVSINSTAGSSNTRTEYAYTGDNYIEISYDADDTPLSKTEVTVEPKHELRKSYLYSENNWILQSTTDTTYR